MSQEVAPLKPIDIVVALRLLQVHLATYAELASDLGISTGWAHASVRRLQGAGLLHPGSRTVDRPALREFLQHGVRYAFPARPGAVTRGVPTAHGMVGETFVWPSAAGAARGRAVAPLYPRATELPQRCPRVYDDLALIDVLRLGDAGERTHAAQELGRRLEPAGGAETERWVATWRGAEPALAAQRRADLEQLTTPRAVAELAAGFEYLRRAAGDVETSGLVEQQRYFQRLAS